MTSDELTTTVIESTTESPTSEPTEDPVTPLELKPVVCEDEANLPGHADIRAGDQRLTASIFCADYFSILHTHYMNSQNETVSGSANAAGTSYFYSVSWIDGCQTTVDVQDPRVPLEDTKLTCTKILVKAFKDCKSIFIRNPLPVIQ